MNRRAIDWLRLLELLSRTCLGVLRYEARHRGSGILSKALEVKTGNVAQHKRYIPKDTHIKECIWKRQAC